MSCLGPYGGPGGGRGPCERGTPVGAWVISYERGTPEGAWLFSYERGTPVALRGLEPVVHTLQGCLAHTKQPALPKTTIGP